MDTASDGSEGDTARPGPGTLETVPKTIMGINKRVSHVSRESTTMTHHGHSHYHHRHQPHRMAALVVGWYRPDTPVPLVALHTVVSQATQGAS